jgi:glycosyltransferase involved in cell wall biosynthesis
MNKTNITDDVTPALSIITAVYQGHQHIASCIESVIQQKYDAVEHIIIDGGSTDGTVEIVKTYLQKYPHIRFISEKDRGQSDALNKGIKLAQSEIIGILNVDDFYEPDVFRQLGAYFLALKEPALLVGNCNVLGENNQLLYVNKPDRLEQIDFLLGNSCPLNPSSYFYHKSLHEKIGYYDETDHFSMDVDFLFKAVDAAHVLYVDKCWGNFSYIPGTKTYEDVKSGGNKKRIDLLHKKFFNKFPWPKRCLAKFLKYPKARNFYYHPKVRYFYFRIGYYLEDPGPRIWSTLLKHIKFNNNKYEQSSQTK